MLATAFKIVNNGLGREDAAKTKGVLFSLRLFPPSDSVRHKGQSQP